MHLVVRQRADSHATFSRRQLSPDEVHPLTEKKDWNRSCLNLDIWRSECSNIENGKRASIGERTFPCQCSICPPRPFAYDCIGYLLELVRAHGSGRTAALFEFVLCDLHTADAAACFFRHLSRLARLPLHCGSNQIQGLVSQPQAQRKAKSELNKVERNNLQ